MLKLGTTKQKSQCCGIRPPVAPAVPDCQHAHFSGCLQGAIDVRALAAGGDTERHIRRLAQHLELLGIHLRKILVIPDCRQDRKIRRQCRGGKRGPLLDDWVHELDRYMNCVTRAPAVAHGKKPSSCVKPLCHRPTARGNAVRAFVEELFLQRTDFT